MPSSETACPALPPVAVARAVYSGLISEVVTSAPVGCQQCLQPGSRLAAFRPRDHSLCNMTEYPALSATERTRHRRLREQGRADRAELFAVLGAGLVAHLGVLVDGAPMVVPTGYGFDEQHLYLHGSVASQSLAGPEPLACVTVTVVDGLVLARSVFEHAINYRSAMIYGTPRAVTDPEQKLH